MEISNLTFIVTDDCNFNCSYCFQKKEKKTISNKIIKTAVDFFYPFFKSDENVHIGFYGGEPLLAFEQIRYAVRLLMGKNKTGNKHIEFSLTTNGSLLTDEMLDFFNRHRFALMLSFDGLAQDIGRQQGTMEKTVSLLKRAAPAAHDVAKRYSAHKKSSHENKIAVHSGTAYPGIDFEINSVFSPLTINLFSQSLQFIIEQGGTDINFDISTIEEWSRDELNILEAELKKLADFLPTYYKKTGRIPVKNFRTRKACAKPGIFRCSAGKEQMAVTPGGDVYGCFLFHDYVKRSDITAGDSVQQDYCFGTLTDFIANHKTRYPEVMAHYAELWQGFYCVEDHFCFLCSQVEGCMICPVNAAYSTGVLGQVSPTRCTVNKILRDSINRFLPPAGPAGSQTFV